MLDRFLDKFEIQADGCWMWTASLNADGYGKFGLNGSWVYAHRYFYESEYGLIPDGFELDHICRSRACVRPSHLEVVEHLVNIQRGLTGKINHWESTKTHCPQGHEYTPDNLVAGNGNKRKCQTCNRNRARIRRALVAA